MLDERHEETLNGSDEERLAARIAASLEAAMRVEPSADFLARVRGRVGEERARAETDWTGWLSGAAAPVLIALVVIGAAVLRRAPTEVGDSGPERTRPAAPAAAHAPEPGPSMRPSPALRAAGAPSRPRPALGAGVRVEPGQLEALARLAKREVGAPSLSRFVVESLDGAALPALRPASLPRFESEPLAVRSGGWQVQGRPAGGAASVGEEGSGS